MVRAGTCASRLPETIARRRAGTDKEGATKERASEVGAPAPAMSSRRGGA